MKKIFLKSNGLLKTLASSVFFTFLFVLMGNIASAQSFSTDNMAEEAIPVVREYDGQYVQKSTALSILTSILDDLKDQNGSNDAEEINVTLKKVFAKSAGTMLKNGGEVMPALFSGYNAIQNASSNYDVPANTLEILEYFAEELSI